MHVGGVEVFVGIRNLICQTCANVALGSQRVDRVAELGLQQEHPNNQFTSTARCSGYRAAAFKAYAAGV